MACEAADRGQPDNATKAYYDHLDNGGTRASWEARLARAAQRRRDHNDALRPWAVEGGWW